jgi:hypothetical protein
MAAVAPSAGSLTGTGSRKGDGGGKPPRKPTGNDKPRGHYSASEVKDLRECASFCKCCNVLTSVAGNKNVKLDLAFALLAYQSALATADSNEAVRLGTEAAAFLDRNNRNRLEPVHEIAFKKGKGIGKTSTAYALTSLIGHASRDRTIHSGDSACEQCKRGNGNFADCVTVAGRDGSLFSGSCTNCAFPNRYKGCSFYNGSAIGPSKAVATAPTAHDVATRAVTRPRAATQPSRHPEVQVVISPRRPTVSPSPEVANTTDQSTPGPSRHATPEFIANELARVSLTPSTRGHSRTSSAPATTIDPTQVTISQALRMSWGDAAQFVRASIGGWRSGASRAPAWTSGNGVVVFEMLVNPSYHIRPLQLLDGVAQQDREDLESRAIGNHEFVTLTSYGQQTLGATSIRAHALVYLYTDYSVRIQARMDAGTG